MVRKTLMLVSVCMVMLGGLGCGGSDANVTGVEVSATTAPLENNPALQDAMDAANSGQPLSGRQERLLKDARQDGVIQ